MANKSKKILTQEITQYIQNELDDIIDAEIEDHQTSLIKQVFKKDDYKVTDYFYQADSLRLRAAGYQLLKHFFDHEIFDHTRKFNVGEILLLSKKMNAPFYIIDNQITLFNNEHIVMCKLSGSVAVWLDNIS